MREPGLLLGMITGLSAEVAYFRVLSAIYLYLAEESYVSLTDHPSALPQWKMWEDATTDWVLF